MKLIIDNIEIHDVESLNLDNDKLRVTLMQDTGKPHFEGCAVVDVEWHSSNNTIVNPVLISAWDEDDRMVKLENWEELKSRLESILVNDNFFLECATI
jgi:hypothetical protein